MFPGIADNDFTDHILEQTIIPNLEYEIKISIEMNPLIIHIFVAIYNGNWR